MNRRIEWKCKNRLLRGHNPGRVLKFLGLQDGFVGLQKQLVLRIAVVMGIALVMVVGLTMYDHATHAATGINGTISYQARITDSAGDNISNGSYNFRYRLYNASTSGTLLWSEQWSSASSTAQVTVTNGLATVALGTHVSLSSLNFNDDSIWLEVGFDADSNGSFEETFAPRRRLTAVPYAFNADKLDGKSESEFADTSEAETITGGYTFSTATTTFSSNINATGLSSLATSTFSKLLTISGGGITVSSGSVTLPANSISDSEVVNALTVSGGTITNSPINNSTIGATTPSTGVFTAATSTILRTTTLKATGTTTLGATTTINGLAYTWPSSGAANGEFLKYNTNGVLTWEAASGGSSLFTDSGSFTYLTSTSDDVVFGASATSTAPFYFDVSAATVRGNGTTTISTGGGSLLLRPGAFVGIGTTSPTATLHVQGGARITGLASCNTIDTDANGVLSCGTDEGGGGSGGSIGIKENNTLVEATTTIFDFLGNDFVITEAGGEAEISLDYTNSKIIRSDQNETISGNYTLTGNLDSNGTSTFATTTFEKLLTVSGGGASIAGGLTVSSGTVDFPNASIALADLATSTINYGGVKLTLGQADVTPAFNLIDASGLPITAGTTGTLGIARGGTGLTTVSGAGQILYSSSADTLAFLGAGTSGQLLQSGGVGAPSWVSTSTLTVATSTTALNAQLLDNIDSGSFLRSDASDAFTSGTLTFNAGTQLALNSTTTFPSGIITSLGNIGVGTTTPGANALYVVGQCVTGDTRLRRRRKKKKKGKNGKPLYDYDEVPIKDIKEGDEIQSLDEHTGTLVWSRVNKLMEMGVKELIRITTTTGRQIRTTAEHPYFVRTKNHEQTGQKLYRFEVDQSIKIESFSQDSVIAIANSEQSASLVIPAKLKQLVRDNMRHYNAPQKMKAAMFAAGIVEAIGVLFKRGVAIHELVIDQEYPGHDTLIADIVSAYHPTLIVSFAPVGKKSPAHYAAYGVHTKQKAADSQATAEVERITKNALRTPFLAHKGASSESPRAFSTSSLYAGEKFVKGGTWQKVKQLRVGQFIAVAHGTTPAWEKITTIQALPAEKVYDIEVEGTHNFVGNDIIAHNTYITGTTTISQTGATSLDIAGGLNAGTGNVGIIDSTGKIPALSSTYFADLSGANLTSVDADTLDSLDSTALLRANTSDTFTGTTLTLTGNLDANGTSTFATTTFEKLVTISSGGLTVSSGTITLPDASIVKDDLANSGTLGFDWADGEIADALTISGGTINNSTIGATTPSTGVFTAATSTILRTTTLKATGTTTLGATTTINGLAYTWPSSGAANGEFLKYNTNGVLTWDSVSAGLFTDSGSFTYLTSTSDDLVFGASATSTAPFYFDVSATTLEATSTLTLKTRATDADIVLSPAGNVGIGATSPGAKLDVTGGIRASSPFLAPNGSVSAPGYAFTTAGDSGLYLVGSNNVRVAAAGVNTLTVSDTQVILPLSGSAGAPSLSFVSSNTGLFYPTTNSFAVTTAGTERIRVTSTGEVGIGTTTPATTLDVEGDLNVTATSTFGKLLTVSGGGASIAGGLTVGSGTVDFPSGAVANADLANSSITVAGDSGSSAVALGGTLTIAGGTNLTTSESGGTVTLNVDDAFLSNSATDTFSGGKLTVSNTFAVNGTSTFATTTFEKLVTISSGGLTVSSGTITLPDASIVKDDLANSGTLGFDWADGEIADALTISGGTINNSTIGATTPSTGVFTAATSTILRTTTLKATGTTTLGATTTINGLAYTWPSSGAANGEVLQYNTNGILTWESAGGGSLFTDAGAFTYLTATTTDDFVIGSNAQSTSTAELWLDLSANTLYGDIINLNHSASSGYLLDINNTNSGGYGARFRVNSSDILTVGDPIISSAVPLAVTAAGDTGIAYDLLFTNIESSHIKSSGPLYITAGDPNHNEDLVLGASGSGIVEIRGGDSLAIPNGYLCVDNGDSGPCSGNSSYSAGTIYASSTSITAEDFAENYVTSDPTLGAGDVVVFDTLLEGGVTKATTTDSSRLAGIVSSAPGVLLGSNRPGDNRVPVALSGKVPVKISTENGAIGIGDPLTSSSQPGVAMKATDAGRIVGYALEPYNASSTGATVLTFVSLEYYSGALTLGADGQIMALDSAAAATATGTTTATSTTAAVNVRTSWLDSLTAFVRDTWSLVVGRVATKEFSITAGDSEQGSAVGQGVIVESTYGATVINPAVKATSKIFVTMRGATEGWWIEDQKDGEFTVKIQLPQPRDTHFDYFIVQVEGDDTVDDGDEQEIEQEQIETTTETATEPEPEPEAESETEVDTQETATTTPDVVQQQEQQSEDEEQIEEVAPSEESTTTPELIEQEDPAQSESQPENEPEESTATTTPENI